MYSFIFLHPCLGSVEEAATGIGTHATAILGSRGERGGQIRETRTGGHQE